METITVRNVVLGAGAIGSATAYHLAIRGEPVCLIEQFALGHDRGSSHGAARITRHSYGDVRFARLMPHAFQAWRELEADAGQNLYLRTGGISFCTSGGSYVDQVAASLRDVGIAHRKMNGQEVNRIFPQFDVPRDAQAVFEPDAGILAAAKALRVELALARAYGGDRTQVIENCPVKWIDLDGSLPTIVTEKGRIMADRLIITAGPWTKSLVPNWPVPLQPTHQQVLYFRPENLSAFLPGGFPVFIVKDVVGLGDYYGMPAFEGLAVKIARHGGPEIDPDLPEKAISDDYIEMVRQFLRGWLPSLADSPIDFTENCIYTNAPDEQFHVGPLAGRSDVFVASTCSGHGFKFSCLIGRILADLATLGHTDLPIDAWQPAGET